MTKTFESPEHRKLLEELKDVRAQAIEQMQVVVKLAQERRRIIESLLAEGFSQADVARELGVTRQAIQKMISVGAERSR